MKNPSAQYVRECFSYEPDTGRLVWKHRPVEHFSDESYQRRWNARFASKEAANIAVNGYKRVNISNTVHFVHRIIWLWVRGEFPRVIDHINGDPADNRWENLRAVSDRENARNSRLPASNTSGVIGVSYSRRDDLWHAYIGAGDGSRISLGHFRSRDAAIAARKGAEARLGYHQNHGRAS